ncbi:MAG: Vps62-related protein, partial [Candidatus Rifleibacteriota bacterium]
MKKPRYFILAVFVAFIATKAIAQNNYSHFMNFFNIADQNLKTQKEKSADEIIAMQKQAMENMMKKIKDIGIILTPHFRCRYTKKFSKVLTYKKRRDEKKPEIGRRLGDKEERQKSSGDLSVWRPECPEGWIRFGDVAVPYSSDTQPNNSPALLVEWNDEKPAGDAQGPFLARPIRFEHVCSFDDNSRLAGSFWQPVPPEGYVAMGFVGSDEFEEPNDLGLIRCVRKDLVYPAFTDQEIFNNMGFHEENNFWIKSFAVNGNYADKPSLNPNTFFIAGGRNSLRECWVLKGLSGDDAYNDTRNGYVIVAAKAFVGRIQQAVANSRQTREKELEQKISGLYPQADSGTQVAGSPDLDETLVSTEKSDNQQDSAHNLPGIDMTSDQFKSILSAIQKQGANPDLAKIPALSNLPMLKGLKFENAVLSQGSIAQGDEKGQPWLSVDGNAVIDIENAGKITGRVIFLARLFKKTGLMTAAIVTLPTTDFLKKFSVFDQKPIDQIGLSDTAFTLANGNHEWLLKEFPEIIKKDLASFAGNDDTAFPFTTGKGAWMSAEVKNSSILAAPFSILKTQPPKVMFSAIFPNTKDESVKIRAKLLTGFDPKFLPIGDFLNLGLPTIEFTLGDLKNIAILTELKLNLAKLSLKIPLRMDFPVGVKFTSVSVTGFLPCKWENALGIPGFSLSDIGISGSFGKLPSLALSGLFELSADWKMDMMGALSFTSPTGLSGLSCRLDRDIGLGDLITLHSLLTKLAFPKMPVPEIGKIDLPFIDLKLRDPFFCVSQIDIPPLNIREGITCSGTLLLGGTELGGGYFWMLKDKGIECQAWVKSFGFGPLKISG